MLCPRCCSQRNQFIIIWWPMDHCNSSQRCLAEVRGTWRVRVRVRALTGRGRGAVPVFAAVFTSAAFTAAALLAAAFTAAAFSSDGRSQVKVCTSLWCAATVEAASIAPRRYIIARLFAVARVPRAWRPRIDISCFTSLGRCRVRGCDRGSISEQRHEPGKFRHVFYFQHRRRNGTPLAAMHHLLK